MNTLILAAGFGTRLYPLTRDVPKALINVNGKLMIEHIIEKIREVNPERIYILSNSRFYPDFLEWVNNYKNDNKDLKIKVLSNSVNYDYEKKGAVEDFKFSLKFIEDDDLLLLASDNLFDFSLAPLINLSNKENSSSVILRKTDDLELIKRCNHVFLDKNNQITFYEEKPGNPRSNLFSIACYFLKKQDVKKIKEHDFKGLDNFGEIISFLYKECPVYGYLSQGFWADIGSKEELEKVREYLKRK